MLIYWLLQDDPNYYNQDKGEASQLHFQSNCKHPASYEVHNASLTQQACNWDDQTDMVEVTQMLQML